MKNFPHQINQLPKLTEAITVFARLIERGADVADDGVVGDALAQAGVYTFRLPGNQSVAALLQKEHAKPFASQGTRTCARELRRFFSLLGFLQPSVEATFTLAPSARSILAFTRPEDREPAHDVWRQALLNLMLEDDTGSSHPYRILLRLTAAMQNLPKPYAGLCFEAKDDSENEFRRIRRIAAHPNPTSTMNALDGATMARNSIKILPSLAKQLGDLVEAKNHLRLSDRIADQLGYSPGRAVDPGTIQNLVRRPFAPRRRRTGGTRRRAQGPRQVVRVVDPDQVGERYNAHEDLLDRFSRMLPAGTCPAHAVYDLLVTGTEAVLLVEAKTIRNDAPRQVRAALGQLFFYEYFDVSPLHPGKTVLRLVLTDHPIAPDLQAFLTKNQIGALWLPEQATMGGTLTGLAHLGQFAPRANQQ